MHSSFHAAAIEAGYPHIDCLVVLSTDPIFTFVQPAMCFKDAYDTLGAEVTRGKSVNMQKIWQLVQVIF